MDWKTYIELFDKARKERRIKTYSELRFAAKSGYSPEEAAEANDAEVRDYDDMLKAGVVAPYGWSHV